MVAARRAPIVFPGGEEFIPPDVLTKKAGKPGGKGVGGCLKSEKTFWRKLRYEDRETGETRTVQRIYRDDKQRAGAPRHGGNAHISAMFGRTRGLMETLWGELHVSQQEQSGFAAAHYYPETFENYNTMFQEIQDLCSRRTAQQCVHNAINQREQIVKRIAARARRVEFLDNDEAGQVFADQLSLEVADLVRALRFRTLELVSLIYKWRTLASGKQFAPFIWRGVNYIQKMATDLDFIQTTHLGTVLKEAGITVKGNPLLLWPAAYEHSQSRAGPTNAKDAIKLSTALWSGGQINALANLQIKKQKHRILRSLGVADPVAPTAGLLQTEKSPIEELTLRTTSLTEAPPERKGVDPHEQHALAALFGIGQKLKPRVAYAAADGGVKDPPVMPSRAEDLHRLMETRAAREAMAATGGANIATLNKYLKEQRSKRGRLGGALAATLPPPTTSAAGLLEDGTPADIGGSGVTGIAPHSQIVSASPAMTHDRTYMTAADTSAAASGGMFSAVGGGEWRGEHSREPQHHTTATGSSTFITAQAQVVMQTPTRGDADDAVVLSSALRCGTPLRDLPDTERRRVLAAARGCGPAGLRSISSINTAAEDEAAAAKQQKKDVARHMKRVERMQTTIGTPSVTSASSLQTPGATVGAGGGFHVHPTAQPRALPRPKTPQVYTPSAAPTPTVSAAATPKPHGQRGAVDVSATAAKYLVPHGQMRSPSLSSPSPLHAGGRIRPAGRGGGSLPRGSGSALVAADATLADTAGVQSGPPILSQPMRNTYKYPAHLYETPALSVYEVRKASIRRLLGPSELSEGTMVTCDKLIHAELPIQQGAAMKAILIRKCYAIEVVKQALKKYKSSVMPLHIKQLQNEKRRQQLKSELEVYEKADDEAGSDDLSARMSDGSDSFAPSSSGSSVDA